MKKGNTSTKSRTVWHYDAFTTQAGKGNPAGIVPAADGLSQEEMQQIAKAVGYNETVFICQSQMAEYRFRYFTPGQEIELCGHGTVAAVSHLCRTTDLAGKSELTIETKAGLLPVDIQEEKGQFLITMAQARPAFLPFSGNVEHLANSMGLQVTDIAEELPILYGSTGTWTLLVPISGLEVFSRMKPQNQLFPQILTENPGCSVHPFCLGAYSPQRHTHGRHFSSAFSGTVEDPVTGTAAGVLGAYLARYVEEEQSEYSFLMEQGQELGRDGEVAVRILRDDHELRVFITGTAVLVDRWQVNYLQENDTRTTDNL